MESRYEGVPIEDAVFQALGEASVCWEWPRRAGEFQSLKAKEIGNDLLKRINQEINNT